MKKSNEIGKLISQLALFQKEMPVVAKDGEAKISSAKGSYGYTFATFGDVLSKANPILSKHGIFVSQSVEVIEDKHLIFTLIAHEDQWLEYNYQIPASIIEKALSEFQPGQKLQAVYSYFLRNLFIRQLNIATDDIDEDGSFQEQNKPKSNPVAVKPAEKMVYFEAKNVSAYKDQLEKAGFSLKVEDDNQFYFKMTTNSHKATEWLTELGIPLNKIQVK